MPGGIDSLPADVRDRLVRFGERLERVELDDLPLYAVRATTPGHHAAVRRALAAAVEHDRTDAAEDARSAVVEFVLRLYGIATYRPTFVGLNWGQGLGTTEDRVRVARTLGEAVLGLVVWDVLDAPDLDELLGPWRQLAA